MTRAIQRTQRRLARQAARKNINDRTVQKQRTQRGSVISENLVQIRGTYYDAEGAGSPGTVAELVNIGRRSRAFFRPANSNIAAPAGSRTGGSTLGSAAVAGSYTGILSHNQLLNLDNSDDHPQYLTLLRGDAYYYRQSFVDAHIADVNAHHNKLHELDDNLHHRLTGAAPYTFVGTDATGGPTVSRHVASHDAQAYPNALLKALNGRITVDELTAQTQIVTPQITSPDGNYLDLDPSLDIRTANTMRSYNWFSGLTGAGINWATGVADFRKLTVDELFADAFTAAVTKALAGAFIVTKSMSRIAKPFVVPATGQSAPLQIWDIPGFAGMDVFEAGDEIMLPFFQIGDTTPGAPDAVYHVDTNVAGGAGVTGGATTYLDQPFDTTPGDWTTTDINNSLAAASSLFSVVSGAWRTTSAGSNFHSHWTGSGSGVLKNYRYTGRFRIGASSSGCGFTFFSSYPSADSYYRIRRYSGGATLHMSPHGASTGPNGGTTDSGYNPAAGTWHRFKIEVEDAGTQTLIRAKFWVDGAAEPTTWQIDCYDSTSNRYTAGTIGVWGYNDDSGADYDDILVESLYVSEGSNTTLAVAKPAGTMSGDLIIMAVSHDTTASVSCAGFTATDSGTQNGKKLTLLTRVAGNGEPGEYTVEMGTADDAGVTITAFRSVGNTPIAEISVQAGNGTSVTSGGLYPVLDNSMTAIIVATMNDQVAPASPGSGVYFGGSTGVLSAESSVTVFYDNDQDVGTASAAHAFTYSSAQDYVMIELMITSNPAGTSGSSVAIGRAWATVQPYTTPPETVVDGAQIWQATIQAGTSGYTILADAPVLDYGKDGDGVIEMTTLDPNGSPYIRAFYRGLHAWDTTDYDVIFQAGNIDGTPAQGIDGFYTKQKVGYGDGSIEMSDAGALINNVPIKQTYGSYIVAWLEAARARFGKNVGSGVTSLLIDHITGDITLGRETAGGFAKWIEATKTFRVTGEIHILPASTGYDNIADGTTYGKVRQTILGNGYILVGSGTKDSTLDGWAIGQDNEIVGQLDGVDQVKFNLSGEITAGLDRVRLNRDGIRVEVASGLLVSRRYSFVYPGTSTEVAYIAGRTDNLISGYPSQVILAARGANGGAGEAWLYGYGASDGATNFGYGAEPYYGSAIGATTNGVKVRGKGLLVDKDGLHSSQVPAGKVRITDDYNTWGDVASDPNTGALLFGTQAAAYGPFGGGYVLLRQVQSTNPTTPAGFGAIYFSGASNTLVVKFPNGTVKGIALTS